MMVAEIYSKLPDYLEGALISRQEAPTVQLPLTEALQFRMTKLPKFWCKMWLAE